MKLVEVKAGKDVKRFLNLARKLYKDDPNWVCPLDIDIESIFNPARNAYFRHGEATRWILEDETGNSAGRVAAFINYQKA